MNKSLTKKQKLEYFPFIIERDDAFVCFYCNKKLTVSTCIYDHLNDKQWDNRLENLVFACQSCNNKKPKDSDIQIKATEKLRASENQHSSNLLSERKLEEERPMTEIDISTANRQISRRWLTERITTDGSVLYEEALNSITFLCTEATGHGSQQAVRGYLNALTSLAAPFMIVKNDAKKRTIARRSGN